MYQLDQLIARYRMCFASLLVSYCGHLADCFRLCLPVQHRPLAFRAQKFQLVLILVYAPSIYLKFRQNCQGAHLQRGRVGEEASDN